MTEAISVCLGTTISTGAYEKGDLVARATPESAWGLPSPQGLTKSGTLVTGPFGISGKARSRHKGEILDANWAHLGQGGFPRRGLSLSLDRKAGGDGTCYWHMRDPESEPQLPGCDPQ